MAIDEAFKAGTLFLIFVEAFIFKRTIVCLLFRSRKYDTPFIDERKTKTIGEVIAFQMAYKILR